MYNDYQHRSKQEKVNCTSTGVVYMKQEDIKALILSGIQNGRYKKGQRLPSCRKLAGQLGVNKITVNKAYESLESEHFVYSIPRGGYYVIGDMNESSLGLVDDVVDYRLVKPDLDLVPFRAFQHCSEKAIERYKGMLFNDTVVEGLISLRKTLVKHLEKDNIFCHPDQLIITHGVQQGVDLSFQCLLKENKTLLIESPTYTLALKRADQLGIPMVTIDRSAEGIDLESLEECFKSNDIGAFYMMTRYHNPTAYSLKESQKQAILKLCQSYDVWLIEDDYLGDLGQHKEGAPLHYYDTMDKVIYLRSFSKTFMPGIRIGLMVCPPGLTQKMKDLKKALDLGTSLMNQGALEVFIESGMYEKHINKIKKAYEEKLKIAGQILTDLPEGVRVHIPEVGIFIWIEWPEDFDLRAHIKKLEVKGIRVTTAENHYLKEGGRQNMRICLLSVPKSKLYTLSEVVAIPPSFK